MVSLNFFPCYASVYREFNKALLQCRIFKVPTWEFVKQDRKADKVKPALEKLCPDYA